MMGTEEIDATSIVAPISYIASLAKYEEEIPYYLLEVESTPDVPSTNIELVTKSALIKDLRLHGLGMTVTADSFQLVDWPYPKIRFNSNYDEVEEYCKDMQEMLTKELKAEKVFVFDFRFRSSKPGIVITGLSSMNEEKYGKCDTQDFFAEPVHKAHVDQTQEGGLRRLALHLTEDEFSQYLSDAYRVRIVNVWRSFNDTAQDQPLAFCHPKSIGHDDPLAIEIVESNRTGENYYLRYSEEHQWFWISDMTPSEAVIFTTWDSEKKERATNCTYHTAFPNPNQQTSPRMSLEIRTIVVNRVM